MIKQNNKELKMKNLITDYNGIVINDKPIKPEDIMVTITNK